MKEIKVYQVLLKDVNELHACGSIAAIYSNGIDVGVKASTLYNHDFEKPYENRVCLIKMSKLLRSSKTN